MKALVTGSAGFVGRHMVAELRRRGWDVAGVDIRPHPANAPDSIQIDAREIFNGKVLEGQHFDLVVHCAYHVGGRAAIDGEPRLLARNIELDAQLFDWAVRTGQGAVLYYSSSAAYPVELQHAESWTALTESMISLEDARQPDARYGWAKLTGERLAAAAALSGLRVHVVRPFSGYGADQDDCYPFPAILRRVRDRDLTVWGPPGQMRDWIHISDVVAGSLAVYDANERRPVNLCTGHAVEMGDLAVRMAIHAGVPAGGVTYLADKPTGVMVRYGNPDRMHSIYRPVVSIDQGIIMALEETR